jgi:hypothetical protein
MSSRGSRRSLLASASRLGAHGFHRDGPTAIHPRGRAYPADGTGRTGRDHLAVVGLSRRGLRWGGPAGGSDLRDVHLGRAPPALGGRRVCRLCATMGRLTWCGAYGLGCDGTAATRYATSQVGPEYYAAGYREAALPTWGRASALRLRDMYACAAYGGSRSDHVEAFRLLLSPYPDQLPSVDPRAAARPRRCPFLRAVSPCTRAGRPNTRRNSNAQCRTQAHPLSRTAGPVSAGRHQRPHGRQRAPAPASRIRLAASLPRQSGL